MGRIGPEAQPARRAGDRKLGGHEGLWLIDRCGEAIETEPGGRPQIDEIAADGMAIAKQHARNRADLAEAPEDEPGKMHEPQCQKHPDQGAAPIAHCRSPNATSRA
jgi:hypothetical protein